METTWLYLKSEPSLWTVGFYTPKGQWTPESDWDSKEKAADRVHWLNGGSEMQEEEMRRQCQKKGE